MSEIRPPTLMNENVLFRCRPNEGLDFGAYKYGLSLFDSSLYDYFIFINDTVRGPLNPNFITSLISPMLIDQDIRLTGVTINCANSESVLNPSTFAHVQSYVFCTDRVGLSIVREVLDIKCVDKLDIINKKEIGMSRYFVERGYNIACLMPEYSGYDFRKREQKIYYGDPQFRKYIKLYSSHTRLPFIKTNRDIDPISYYPSSFPQQFEESAVLLLSELKSKHPSAWKGHLEFAIWLVKTFDPKVTVDLGVDFAHSTFSWACRYNNGEVYGIDSFEGDLQAGIRSTLPIVQEWKNKLQSLGLISENLTLIAGYFKDVAKIFTSEYTSVPIEILHIDGFHTYENVKEDYETWSPLCSENCIYIFHDVESFPEVRRFFKSLPQHKVCFSHSAGLGVACSDKQKIDLVKSLWIDRLVTHNNHLLNIEYGLEINSWIG